MKLVCRWFVENEAREDAFGACSDLKIGLTAFELGRLKMQTDFWSVKSKIT
jgi:hypothetical protein